MLDVMAWHTHRGTQHLQQQQQKLKESDPYQFGCNEKRQNHPNVFASTRMQLQCRRFRKTCWNHRSKQRQQTQAARTLFGLRSHEEHRIRWKSDSMYVCNDETRAAGVCDTTGTRLFWIHDDSTKLAVSNAHLARVKQFTFCIFISARPHIAMLTVQCPHIEIVNRRGIEIEAVLCRNHKQVESPEQPNSKSTKHVCSADLTILNTIITMSNEVGWTDPNRFLRVQAKCQILTIWARSDCVKGIRVCSIGIAQNHQIEACREKHSEGHHAKRKFGVCERNYSHEGNGPSSHHQVVWVTWRREVFPFGNGRPLSVRITALHSISNRMDVKTAVRFKWESLDWFGQKRYSDAKFFEDMNRNNYKQCFYVEGDGAFTSDPFVNLQTTEAWDSLIKRQHSRDPTVGHFATMTKISSAKTNSPSVYSQIVRIHWSTMVKFALSSFVAVAYATDR